MLATLGDKAFDDTDWFFENKFDGYRAIAAIQKKNIKLYSRNGLSFDELFKPLFASLGKIGADVILDGEVVVEDPKGKAEFQLLQNYKRTRKGNLVFYVFDMIWLNGYSLTELPFVSRRELLQTLFQSLKLKDIRLSEAVQGKGIQLFEIAEKNGLEGIIAKHSESTYLPGKRSRDWIKIKTELRQEAIICGYTEPKGGRKLFGSLILGIYKDGELSYCGHCGGGFNEELLISTYKKMKPMERKSSPFKTKPKTNTPVTWVEPKLICEVKFSEWTQEGSMRHPVFMGLRNDKAPGSITREKPVNSIDMAKENKNDETLVNTEVTIDRKKVRLTNLNKMYWPEEGITKGDLIEYYRKMGKVMLPYLKDRPESLHRHPNGINKQSFFQKDMDVDQLPAWVKTIPVHSESNDKDIDYLLCQNEATLIYMANLGCIEINPWLSRTKKIENPDYMVIDLDPEDIEFSYVVETAQEVKKLADELKLDCFCKTSGATGLHIYFPMKAKYTFDQVKDFAHLFAQEIHRRLPKITSIERSPGKRQKKIYVDFLQNRRGQTLAAPYSVRPKPGATVSAPLKWDEVNKDLSPSQFTIKNMEERVNQIGDIWDKVLGPGADMMKSLSLLEELRGK